MLLFELLENRVMLSALPAGLSPAQVLHAYGFDKTVFNDNGVTRLAVGRGQTIAIVDAYGDPNIANDLVTFDATYGITNTDIQHQFALTVATPEGTPSVDPGWAQEISLDVEWAHAIAYKAHILLVEAKSDTFTDLMTAVNYAKSQPGVVAVSMSWGANEYRGERNYDSVFTTPTGHLDNNGIAGGVTYLTASGDSGGGSSYPSSSPNVVSVGGTSLNVDSAGNYLSETAWSGSGGGTSWVEHTDMPDVSYNADLNTGYAVYDSTPFQGQSGWAVFGGTSAGSPQWAALIADIDQGRSYLGEGSLDGVSQTIPALYALPASDFHDITSGNNGVYAAGVGYDLVTGLGSPVVPRIIDDMVGNGITGDRISTTQVVPVWQISRTATHFAPAKHFAAVSHPFAAVAPIAPSQHILPDTSPSADAGILKGVFDLTDPLKTVLS